MRLESILSTVDSSGIAGCLIGFVLKRALNIGAMIVGLPLTGLTYLQSQSILSINRHKLKSISQSISLLIGIFTNGIGIVTNITNNAGSPLIRGLSRFSSRIHKRMIGDSEWLIQ